MAGIGKVKKEDRAEDSIESLEREFGESTDKIRQLLAGKKDKNSISDEVKTKLRAEYSRAAQIARTLSQRVTDEDEVKKYEDFFKRLSDRAASYGSVIKSRVPKTTFDDVKGLDNVKKLVKSFMFMAQNPEILKYYKLEGGLGMLMYGAPGTGKTMFAEAIANAMNLPLFIVTPADIFKSYVGESEQAVKQIFQEIDACPEGAILFVDECESIFSRRNQDTKDYKAAVTTELLQRINGFGVDGSKRIMIAATNRPDVIDPAYLRYKRFSHLIHVTPPDEEAKRAIIESKLSGIALDGITAAEVLDMSKGVTYKETALGMVAAQTAYYSAADLCGIIEEACRLALEKLQESGSTTPIPLTRDMFERAFKKIPPSISQELLDEYNNFR
ncbi:MAG TPA: ATP-binding protein [Firmicutes bacterium]|nr:ATP-binding protein [Bacillota bacterium]